MNGYGLFRVMTKDRKEIVIEGSADGLEWQRLRIQMETRRRDAGAGLVSAASTAVGLADVVRCPRIVSAKSVVCSDGDRVIAWETASHRAF